MRVYFDKALLATYPDKVVSSVPKKQYNKRQGLSANEMAREAKKKWCSELGISIAVCEFLKIKPWVWKGSKIEVKLQYQDYISWYEARWGKIKVRKAA